MTDSCHFDLLVCPRDKRALARTTDELHCGACGTTYPIDHGIPVFFADPDWNELYLTEGHYVSATPFEMVAGDEGYLALRGDRGYGRVLDLGSGDGVFSSKLPADSLSYCVDVTQAGLRRLLRRGQPNLIPLLASGFELPFADDTFDTVLYIFVVEHLRPDEDERMLQEVRRVVRHHGRVLFTTDTPFFDRHLVKWTNLLLRGKWIPQDHTAATGHINLLTMEQSRDLVRRAGFEIIAEHPFWMGERFALWRWTMALLRRLLPAHLSEDYLASKYTFVLVDGRGQVPAE